MAFRIYLGIITGLSHKINTWEIDNCQFVVLSCLPAKRLEEDLKFNGFIKVLINTWHRQVAFKL